VPKVGPQSLEFPRNFRDSSGHNKVGKHFFLFDYALSCKDSEKHCFFVVFEVNYSIKT
jgi:hypothetical protein